MDDELEDAPQAAQETAIAGVLPFRAEAYWHYLEGMDLTDVEKACILQALWTILVGFVDLGFGVDPVQQILPALVHGALEEEFGGAAINTAMREDNA